MKNGVHRGSVALFDIIVFYALKLWRFFDFEKKTTKIKGE